MLDTESRNFTELFIPGVQISPAGPLPILLLGPPGSGKGTQARQLSDRLDFPCISTGELLRGDHGRNLPQEVKECMQKGLLIPDAVVNEIVADRLAEPDCGRGFILDGYPRDIKQARYLDSVLHGLNAQTPVVIHILLSDALVLKRITHRLECPVCRETTAIKGDASGSLPRCPRDGAIYIQRPDDNEQALVNRLQTYHCKIPDLLRFYSGERLFEIAGCDKPDKITASILSYTCDPAYTHI